MKILTDLEAARAVVPRPAATTLVVRDANRLADSLVTSDFRLVSPGAVTVNGSHLGFGKGVLVRDPDGHVMALVER